MTFKYLILVSGLRRCLVVSAHEVKGKIADLAQNTAVPEHGRDVGLVSKSTNSYKHNVKKKKKAFYLVKDLTALVIHRLVSEFHFFFYCYID